MLTQEEIQEIEAELVKYPYKQAVGVEAMKIVQRHRGWVSDSSLEDIARLLEMTPDELESVATFYSLIFRRPVGKHVILVCDSVSCWILGYEKMRQHLSQRLGIQLGETTADGKFTLLPMPCLGACDHAPVMMIDDELIVDLDTDRLDAALSRFDQTTEKE